MSQESITLSDAPFPHETLAITSADFSDGEVIPERFTCHGVGAQPELGITGTPTQARSLVLIMEDPDVPVDLKPDGMFDHWVLFNISPETVEIKPEEVPVGAMQGVNSSGSLGYVPPCPPDREHRYIFYIFALDTTLDLPEGVPKADVLEAFSGHVIDSSHFTGLVSP